MVRRTRHECGEGLVMSKRERPQRGEMRLDDKNECLVVITLP